MTDMALATKDTGSKMELLRDIFVYLHNVSKMIQSADGHFERLLKGILDKAHADIKERIIEEGNGVLETDNYYRMKVTVENIHEAVDNLGIAIHENIDPERYVRVYGFGKDLLGRLHAGQVEEVLRKYL